MLKMKNNIKRTTLKVSVYGYKVEEVINSAITYGIKVYSAGMRSKSCMVITIDEKDYEELLGICRKNKCKVEVYYRQGVGKVLDIYKSRISFILTFVFFITTIWILNSIVWEVNVGKSKYISPYEVKELLRENNIKVGMKKAEVDSEAIKKLLKETKGLSWIDVQIIGGRLCIQFKEREELPKELEKRKPGSIVAKKDGVISRVYASEGEILVEPGDVIKKGDYLIGAIQGKESREYLVHSEGKVFAKTFYERSEVVKKERKSVNRTGNKSIQLYFLLFGKKIYLINDLNNFENYDKIIDNKGPFKKITYYEVEKKKEKIEDFERYVKEIQKNMESDMKKYLGKETTVIDSVKKCDELNGEYRVSVILIVEEDIAIKRRFDESQIDELMKIIREKRQIELENWIKQNL